MSVLVKFNRDKTGPDGLYPVQSRHHNPQSLKRSVRASFDARFPYIPEMEREDGFSYSLFGDKEGNLAWYKTPEDEEKWTKVLDVPKELKKDEAKEERDRRIAKGVVLDGVRYSSDSNAERRVDAAARDAEKRGTTRRWKGRDVETGETVRVEMDADALNNLHAAIEDHIQAHFDAEEALADQILDADDPTGIDVTDDSHWP